MRLETIFTISILQALRSRMRRVYSPELFVESAFGEAAMQPLESTPSCERMTGCRDDEPSQHVFCKCTERMTRVRMHAYRP